MMTEAQPNREQAEQPQENLTAAVKVEVQAVGDKVVSSVEQAVAAAQPPPEERGDKPMLAEAPSFDLAGYHYQMRLLNYQDFARLAGIVRAGITESKIDVLAVMNSGNVSMQVGAVISLLLNSLSRAETPTFGFLASVLGVDRPTLFNPKRFPFSSLPMVIRKLSDHPDIQDFFVQVGEELKGQATPTPPSSGPATSSADAAGPTSES